MIVAVLGLFAAASFPGSADASPLAQGYRDMYNLSFDKAHRAFRDWEKAHPQDPLGPVSDAAAYLFSEFDRLRILQSEFFVDHDGFFHNQKRLPADPEVKRKFETGLNQSQALADAILREHHEDGNAQFATILRIGLHADYTALVEKRDLASLNEIKQSRGIAEQLLANHPDFYDAYLAVGVENYLLSLKAPPIRWFLRANGAQTNKQRGISNLRLTAEKGHYLLPYARLLLAVAALRDHDTATAKSFLAWLAAQFPANHLYREELAKIE